MRKKTTWPIGILLILLPMAISAQKSLYETYRSSGMKAYEQGNYAESEKFFKAAVVEALKIKSSEHVAISSNDLGIAMKAQRKYGVAEAAFKVALDIFVESEGPASLNAATTLNNLGLVCNLQKKNEQAEEYYRLSLNIREMVLGPNSSEVAISLLNLGKLYYEQGKYTQAHSLFRRAMTIWTDDPPEDAYYYAACANNLALVYTAQGDFVEAERVYKLTIAFDERTWGSNTPNLISHLENYADLLRKMSRKEEAAKLEARAKVIRNNLRK
jgi:tetratricopeptide (TPR) repeat protein